MFSFTCSVDDNVKCKSKNKDSTPISGDAKTCRQDIIRIVYSMYVSIGNYLTQDKTQGKYQYELRYTGILRNTISYTKKREEKQI